MLHPLATALRRSERALRPGLLAAASLALLLLGASPVAARPPSEGAKKTKSAGAKKKKQPAQKPEPADAAADADQPPKAAPATRGTRLAREALDQARKLAQNQRHEEAVQASRQCLRHDPKLTDCHYVLGVSYAAQGDTEQAEAAYRQYLKMAPASGGQAARARQFLQRLQDAERTPPKHRPSSR